MEHQTTNQKIHKQPIIILAHVVNKTVIEGFLPAALNMGYPVYIFTDQAIAHQSYFSASNLAHYPSEIIACDVFNAQAIIDLILQLNIKASAIFSNSDHLQTACAQAAAFFNLPAKNWQTCYRAKNKYAMRQYLQEKNLLSTWFSALHNLDDLAQLSPPFPCVVKPQQGVASMDVQLCHNNEQLTQFCGDFWQHHSGQALIIEGFISGQVFTLETLGDGENIVALGGFDVEISPPPYFIERHARWTNDLSSACKVSAFAQIKAFGVNFGSCHSEFILTEQGPRLIEINYRTIGGNKEFLLNRLANFDYFSQVLKLYLGEKLPKNLAITGEAVAHYFTAERNGNLITQPAAFELDYPHFIKLEHIKKTGQAIKHSNSDRDRLSILIAHTLATTKTPALSLDEAVQAITDDLIWELT